MSGVKGWILVIPPKGSAKATAAALLAAADSPSQVRTQSNGDEFLVHPDVADRYGSQSKPRRSRAKKEDS